MFSVWVQAFTKLLTEIMDLYTNKDRESLSALFCDPMWQIRKKSSLFVTLVIHVTLPMLWGHMSIWGIWGQWGQKVIFTKNAIMLPCYIP